MRTQRSTGIGRFSLAVLMDTHPACGRSSVCLLDSMAQGCRIRCTCSLHQPSLPEVAVKSHDGVDLTVSVSYTAGRRTQHKLINAIAQERNGEGIARGSEFVWLSLPYESVDCERRKLCGKPALHDIVMVSRSRGKTAPAGNPVLAAGT